MGAGASRHVGYPLACGMGRDLNGFYADFAQFHWTDLRRIFEFLDTFLQFGNKIFEVLGYTKPVGQGQGITKKKMDA
jgi:hypothetical protein